MKVKGIRWIGVGVETGRLSEMRAFATEVLGLQVVGEDKADFVELGMADGAKLELFGSAAAADGPWLFASNPVVAGFWVDDIEAARDELARRRAARRLARHARRVRLAAFPRAGRTCLRAHR
jgi:hypothetical protein